MGTCVGKCDKSIALLLTVGCSIAYKQLPPGRCIDYETYRWVLPLCARLHRPRESDPAFRRQFEGILHHSIDTFYDMLLLYSSMTYIQLPIGRDYSGIASAALGLGSNAGYNAQQVTDRSLSLNLVLQYNYVVMMSAGK